MRGSQELSRDLNEIKQEIASARRRLSTGEVVDLKAVAGRVESLFNGSDPEALRAFEADMVVLISECDDLVRGLEREHAKLAKQMKSERERRDVFSAYGKPANGK